MSEEKNKPTTHETQKPHVRDLETEKDVKGGGGTFKPASATPGGDTTQPVPPSGS
ncbi:MAG: hypothetical protein QOH39_521 [Verrucomicrobiota bacterium]|jgi:hypothetical protein